MKETLPEKVTLLEKSFFCVKKRFFCVKKHLSLIIMMI